MPIATGTTVLTILLPLLATANMLYTPMLNRVLGSKGIQHFILPALQILSKMLGSGYGTFTTVAPLNGSRTALTAAVSNPFSTVPGLEISVQKFMIDIHFVSDLGAAPSSKQLALSSQSLSLWLIQLAYSRRQNLAGAGADSGRRVGVQLNSSEGRRLIEDGEVPYRDMEEEAEQGDHDGNHEASDSAKDGANHRVEPSGLGSTDSN
ncbi:hypothetical protein F5Y16DRAFT_396147 [Xylariaceae sp. FL0255]|nr:hypothetical protein F5Y16DRAFT_396147 [Xylariaceae sp. FL0255]